MDKPSVVLGASPNNTRYSNIAVKSLLNAKHSVFPVGIKEGEIDFVEILQGTPALENIHTVAIYLSPKRQTQYYDYIFSLKPQRILFPPGAENPELENLAKEKGIETINACTMVLLSIGNY